MESSWQPSADLKTLKRRAQLLADVRHFFAQRNVLEVETPILSQAAPTAPYLDCFTTNYVPIGSHTNKIHYLQTSPEFAMKRLLAADSASIYQIARVFRNGEHGRQHAPEFTMLEWYRIDLTLPQLMDEVDDLLQQILQTEPAAKYSYKYVFKNYAGLDVFRTSDEEIKCCALKKIKSLAADFQTERDGWLELLMSEVIEPQLEKLLKPVFVYDYPASQAQLAKIVQDKDGHDVATRFELYAGGMELANGYDELLDGQELRQRFENDNQQRHSQGKPEMPIDENLLTAMAHGLAECSGVALGLDRLMMIAMDKQAISKVQSFSFDRA